MKITAKQMDSRIYDLCKHLGALAYHPFDSRRSNPGFPDWVIVANRLDEERVIFVELKTDNDRVSKDQAYWIERLGAANGVESWIIRGLDGLDALEAFLTVEKWGEMTRAQSFLDAMTLAELAKVKK